MKDFRIKRRFSFPVLQVNSSLPFTVLDVSFTNSDFFFTAGTEMKNAVVISLPPSPRSLFTYHESDTLV